MTRLIGTKMLLTSALAIGLLGLPQNAIARTTSTLLSPTGSPIWQTNKTVWGLGYARGKVWAGGEFTAVRPPKAQAGKQEQPRQHLAVFDGATGNVLPISHAVNGVIRAIKASPDGAVVYVGGLFTTVDKQPRNGVAAFDASTGALLPWHAALGGPVYSIAATSTRVYLGGKTLRAVSSASGAAVGWSPTVHNVRRDNPHAVPLVYALGVSNDGNTVIVGGNFTDVDNAPDTYSAALISATGSGQTVLPFPAHYVTPPPLYYPNQKLLCQSSVKTIDVENDTVFLGNEGTGVLCFDGTWAFSLSTGQLIWVNYCFGATQTVQVVRGWLYKGSHAHWCNLSLDPNGFPQGSARHLLAERLDNGYLGKFGLRGMAPNLGVKPGGLGARAMTTDGNKLWVGGDFVTLNGRTQQGLAAFG